MGAWSSSISGNDTFAEVTDYFKRMYTYQEGGNYKWSVEQIADSLYTYYYPTIQDLPSEKCTIIFAIAQCLWQRGALTKHLQQLVHKLVHDKIDYNAWKDLAASEKTLQARWQASVKFLESLQQKNYAVKTRVLQPKKVSLFNLGDCLAFEYEGYYYGMVVANDGRNYDDGSNEIVFVNIKSKTLPTLQDFKHSNYLLTEHLANFLCGNTASAAANTAFAFKLSKAAMKTLLPVIVNVGTLNFTRAFFISSSLQFKSVAVPHKSGLKLIQDTLAFWLQQQQQSSSFTPGTDCIGEFDKGLLKKETLHFGKTSFKIKDIKVKIQNSLWHINVYLSIKGATNDVIEKNWTNFTALFESLTGREVNGFSIADDTTEGLLPFSQIDFNAFQLKHISDATVV